MDETTTKVCSRCKEEKDLTTGFYSNGKNKGFSSLCRPCKNKQRTEWFLKNEEVNRKKVSEWGKKYYSNEENKKNRKEKNKEWREKNKEYCNLKDKAKHNNLKEKRQTDPEFNEQFLSKQRTYNYQLKLRKVYGLTLDEYDEMILSRGNKCDICGKCGTNTRYGKLCVDHCHMTGTVRGLLCDSCNTGLGSFKDNITFLINAAHYLEQFNNSLPKESENSSIESNPPEPLLT